MKQNIHPYERVGRVGLGLFLSSLAFWGPKNKWYLTFLGLAADGAIGTCPVYSALGISTCPKETKTDKEMPKDVEEQAKEYYPIESSSEIAAGHPIVGVS